MAGWSQDRCRGAKFRGRSPWLGGVSRHAKPNSACLAAISKVGLASCVGFDAFSPAKKVVASALDGLTSKAVGNVQRTAAEPVTRGNPSCKTGGHDMTEN